MGKKITTASLSALALVATALALMAGASAPEHEITLIARNMAFYTPDSDVANPTLKLAPREEVRFTFINLDRGIDHDLTVADLGLRSSVLPGDGSSMTMSFRAPAQPGRHEYTCELHGRMMKGTLLVQ